MKNIALSLILTSVFPKTIAAKKNTRIAMLLANVKKKVNAVIYQLNIVVSLINAKNTVVNTAKKSTRPGVKSTRSAEMNAIAVTFNWKPASVSVEFLTLILHAIDL